MRGASSIACFRVSSVCNWRDVVSAGEEERLQQLSAALPEEESQGELSPGKDYSRGGGESGPDPTMAVGADTSIQWRNSLPETDDQMVTM